MTQTRQTLRIAPRPRHSPAREVQEDIRGLEQVIDDAIAGGGNLLHRMIQVGKAANVAPDAGQAVIERTIACLVAGSTMRAEALAVHSELRGITGKIDLRELGWGDLVNSPETALVAKEPAALEPAAAA